jgi:type IV/VI secretion system ImpK/VasF family protein
MDLKLLTKDFFLLVATFRERLASNSLPSIAEIEREALTVFRNMDQEAERDERLNARYQKIRYGLVALIDEVIFTSDWESAPDWPLLEAHFYNSNTAGHQVYDQISKLSGADEDLAEIWFYILALGFRGKHALHPQRWNDQLVDLHRRLPREAQGRDDRMTPEAYRVISREARRLDPLFNLWRSLLIFAGAMVLLIVMYQVVWWSIINEAGEMSRGVIIEIQDDGLRQSFSTEDRE